METVNYQLKITKANLTESSNTVAHVKVSFGPFWITFNLVRNQEKYFLNAPANFIESLKGRQVLGRPHSGWVNLAGVNGETAKEILVKVLEELGLREEGA